VSNFATMEQTAHWLLPPSEQYQDVNPSSFQLFSTSYARQPDEITDFGVYAPSAGSSVRSTTFQVPCLQDDIHLVELGNSESSLTPEFEASHCQRILFVWRVVFHFCEANHGLALRTWVQLLDSEVGEDIWLWADGDEMCITNSCRFKLYSDYPASGSWEDPGWRLTNSDIRMGISALTRRVEHVRKGVTESLDMMERRKRLHAVGDPRLRFCAIAWSIATSKAMRRADTSRGYRGRNFCSLFDYFSVVGDFLGLESVIPTIDGNYWDNLIEAGHTCHSQISIYEREEAGQLIYIASLVTLNRESDAPSFKTLCIGSGCPNARSSFHGSWLESSQEAEHENHAMNTRDTTNTGPPAGYLVFLWLFWFWVVSCGSDSKYY